MIPATVQYSDAITLTASLSDDEGVPLVGKSLRFDVTGLCSGEALTDASGVAYYLCETSLPAGQYSISVNFSREAGYYLPASSSAWLAVTDEQAEDTFGASFPNQTPPVTCNRETTLISGLMPDQPAPYGLRWKVGDLGLPLMVNPCYRSHPFKPAAVEVKAAVSPRLHW